MKKIYVLTTALFLGANSNAQLVFDFENPILASESYDNGSSGSSNFSNTELTLSNTYSGYWSSGFAFSNTTDVTTEGYTNMYSSYTGAGRASSQYGVCYGSGDITTSNDQLQIDGFYITNSTYAALSMLNGDSFGKQFGSVNGADGNPDGTNGEDFFKVWIIAEDFGGNTKDSVEFYLADYRFSDNTQDYIIADWNYIDIIQFGFSTAKVSFRFESSDNGGFGMNTPAYFAIDDIQYSYIVGIEENQLANVRTFPNPVNEKLTVEGEHGVLTLKDMNGKIIDTRQHNELSIIDCSSLNSGVYFVELRNDQGLATRKIIK